MYDINFIFAYALNQGKVLINGVESDIVSWKHNRIELKTKDGKGGTVNLFVENEFGTNSAANSLAYISPKIDGINPALIGTTGTQLYTVYLKVHFRFCES